MQIAIIRIKFSFDDAVRVIRIQNGNHRREAQAAPLTQAQPQSISH